MDGGWLCFGLNGGLLGGESALVGTAQGTHPALRQCFKNSALLCLIIDVTADPASIADGWSSAYGLFTEGEAPIVISYTTSPVYHVLNEDTTRYQALVFPEGHHKTIESIGILASSDNKEEAQAFVDFILSEGQVDTAIANSMYPANGETVLPEAYDYAPLPEKIFDTDPAYVAANIDRWTEEWTQAMINL